MATEESIRVAFLDRDGVDHRVTAGATVLLGDRDPRRAELGHLGHQLVGEADLADRRSSASGHDWLGGAAR